MSGSCVCGFDTSPPVGHVVDAGAAVDTLDATSHVTTNTVVTPDGKQWFDSTSVSRVTRHRIVKFDER